MLCILCRIYYCVNSSNSKLLRIPKTVISALNNHYAVGNYGTCLLDPQDQTGIPWPLFCEYSISSTESNMVGKGEGRLGDLHLRINFCCFCLGTKKTMLH